MIFYSQMSPSPSSKRPFSITQQKLKLVCEFAGIQKSTLEINAKKKKEISNKNKKGKQKFKNNITQSQTRM